LIDFRFSGEIYENSRFVQTVASSALTKKAPSLESHDFSRQDPREKAKGEEAEGRAGYIDEEARIRAYSLRKARHKSSRVTAGKQKA